MTATGSNAPKQSSPLMHVVLYQPEIPQNTGNIGRTCVALGAKLWMVRPIGFRLDSSQLKRSGMDYWKDLDWELVDSWDQLREHLPMEKIWLVTKHGKRPYCKGGYSYGDVLVFGNESSGLPETIRNEFSHRQICLPMPGPVRCINLATAAGIAIYEVARNLGVFAAAEYSNGE